MSKLNSTLAPAFGLGGNGLAGVFGKVTTKKGTDGKEEIDVALEMDANLKRLSEMVKHLYNATPALARKSLTISSASWKKGTRDIHIKAMDSNIYELTTEIRDLHKMASRLETDFYTLPDN